MRKSIVILTPHMGRQEIVGRSKMPPGISLPKQIIRRTPIGIHALKLFLGHC